MYVKIYGSLFDGSMRGKPDLILVFINMLSRADPDGTHDRHWRSIADETGLPVERVQAAIHELESPDHESRTPGKDGRRIIRLSDTRDWGWMIVNFLRYKGLRNEEDRREQNRQAQRRHRSAAVSIGQ